MVAAPVFFVVAGSERDLQGIGCPVIELALSSRRCRQVRGGASAPAGGVRPAPCRRPGAARNTGADRDSDQNGGFRGKSSSWYPLMIVWRSAPRQDGPLVSFSTRTPLLA